LVVKLIPIGVKSSFNQWWALSPIGKKKENATAIPRHKAVATQNGKRPIRLNLSDQPFGF
jgi:hypothetical protein